MDSSSSSDSERRSSTSSSLSNDEFAETMGISNEFGVLPYQYQPENESISSSESNDNSEFEGNLDEETENNRLTNSSWCICGEFCQVMDSIDECICCQEKAATQSMCSNLTHERPMADRPVPQCITEHPGFSAVCLNKWVLQTAWHQYKQQYNNAYEGPEHKQFRHIAYRQLARWCWGYLGKEVRVILPSCAVMCIRAHFPPPGLEEDFTFEGFHYGDE